MNHLDLFSGIGGFALAAQWMGWETIAFCEQDKYCQKVLGKNFPDTSIYNDIRTIPRIGGIDLITGGFPCQPFSVAGKQASKEDDRYLWPAMLQVIEQEKPTWVIGENVGGIINLALDQVLADLEAKDYSCQSFIIPACSLNAPHRRDRVWIVAHTNSKSQPDGTLNEQKSLEDTHSSRWKQSLQEMEGRQTKHSDNSCSEPEILAHTNNRHCPKKEEIQSRRNPIDPGSQRQHGGWATEPSVGRVANGIPRRVDRCKALGNAVVPQIPFEIFKAINEFQG
jgi:DNA (cytosine-5)-methyltransferase 1